MKFCVRIGVLGLGLAAARCGQAPAAGAAAAGNSGLASVPAPDARPADSGPDSMDLVGARSDAGTGALAPAAESPRDAGAGALTPLDRSARDQTPDAGPFEVPPPALEFVELGLEQRPPNDSCRAWPRPEEGNEDAFPQQLSQTGCMAPEDPSQPGPALIPYGVNMPLWSDGATKRRWMALPDGEVIEVRADGRWVLPVGSVLVKAFYLGQTLVETRLMMRHDDGQWGGYSYAWEPGGADAQLLPTALRRVFDSQEWTYPSRENCGQCHGDAPGNVLGPKTSQLDGLFAYPAGIAPQLNTLNALGLFDQTLTSGASPEALSTPEDALADLDATVRSYLDVNCSHCHQPGGVEETRFDLRRTTPFAETGLCDVPPAHGNFGLFGARLVRPGDPEFSLLSVRMHSSISTVRMPLIGSALVDEQAVRWVDAWIEQMSDCTP